MSNYEFWKDLGKIFNAVVSYQEKSIEFNKRFINPWIKIGNVFDTQDRHREAVHAYQQAVEIDPGNAQNWLDLGNAHFRNETLDEAVDAFLKAIEVDPTLGWPYSNLALTYVLQNRHAEAKLLYEKSIQLLSDDKDKAICWNRLGNLHRKLNEYDLAMQAFQKADELDKENAGFKDEFDEVVAHYDGNKDDEASSTDMIANSLQYIVEQNQADERSMGMPQESSLDVPTEPIRSVVVDLNAAPAPSPTDLPEAEPEVVPSVEEVEKPAAEDVLPIVAEVSEPAVAESDLAVPVAEPEKQELETVETVEVPVATEKIESVLTENIAETFTESLVGMETVTETFQPETPVVEIVTEPLPPVEETPVRAVVDDQLLNAAEDVIDPTTKAVDLVEKLDEPVPQALEETGQAETPTPVVAEVTGQVGENAPEVAEVVSEIPEAVADSPDAPGVTAEPVAEVSDAPEVAAEPVAEVSDAPEVAAEPVAEVSDAPEVAAEPVAEVSDAPEVAAEPAAAVPAFKAEDATPETSDQVQAPAPEVPVQAEPAPEIVVAETATPDNSPEIQSVMASEEPVRLVLEPAVLTPSILDEEPISSLEPITKVDETGEFQMEMDTKNAHVWNELGNVYFNRGAIEDAIVAYSKAIELDRWFAWPYSNLALAYVQKERFAEAMLLYQRSIELFTSNKDKAISWNRLGNVYRRLNDYDNAIASYQRADELDPDNSTIHLQSRFSLLGNYQVEQNAALSS